MRSTTIKYYQLGLAFLTLSALISGCVISYPRNPSQTIPTEQKTNALGNAFTPSQSPSPTRVPPNVTPPPTRAPGQVILTPTPDPVRILPTLRASEETHTVAAGDTLSIIAKAYGGTVAMLVAANDIEDPNLLEIGQILSIPIPVPNGISPAYKIIPDSELVYGPMSTLFDLDGFVASKGGYLSTYTEEVDEQPMSGVEIVARVSREFSVNPKLLLAILEYQSKWVTSTRITPYLSDYPMRFENSNRKGLWRQLTWAANQLNYGYYTWKANVLAAYFLPDGSIIIPADSLNAGTVGVQQLFSQLYDLEKWEETVSEDGLFDTYQGLFGYPFDLAIEPLVPIGLTQPVMQLPFESEVAWSFTGGPHSGWGDGSAWAALDFAPPSDTPGCVPSDAWVTASAPGLVVLSGNGIVVIDLDMDGYLQTGWSILNLHIASQDRVSVGTVVAAGDRIGHPSCEGGVSSGTHVHLARRYNGEWIEAAGSVPFDLDGWVAESTGKLYDGYLVKEGNVVEAWDSRKPENQIER